MSETSIEWTKRGDTRGRTWNPTVGCTKTSAGCKHCYALTMHGRLTLMGQAKYAEPFEVVKPYPQHLALPLTWKQPSTIFVNSMSDLFHEDLPFEYIAAVLGIGAVCPRHTFQILTKRAERLPEFFAWAEADMKGRHRAPSLAHHAACLMREAGLVQEGDAVDRAIHKLSFANWSTWPLRNVWIGVSVENRDALDRLDHLRAIPAAVRFASFEPLLEDLGKVDLTGIDWGIAGAESGHHARGMNEDWVRGLRDQHQAQGKAFFYKQKLDHRGRKVSLPVLDGRQWAEFPAVSDVR